MSIQKNKDLDYWKKNAEEDYKQVPISVLRYISELEEAVKNCSIPVVVGRSEQLPCDDCVDGQKWSPYYGKYVECDCRK